MRLWGRNALPFDGLYLFSVKPMLIGSDAAICYLEIMSELVSSLKQRPADVTFSEQQGYGRLLTDAETEQVALNWNREPADFDQARCHIPRHLLATVNNNEFDWLTSICFECSNVYIAGKNATEKHRIIRGDRNGQTSFQKLLDNLLN